jgi:hypothetical protein
MQGNTTCLSLLPVMAIWKDRKFYLEIVLPGELKLMCKQAFRDIQW